MAASSAARVFLSGVFRLSVELDLVCAQAQSASVPSRTKKFTRLDGVSISCEKRSPFLCRKRASGETQRIYPGNSKRAWQTSQGLFHECWLRGPGLCALQGPPEYEWTILGAFIGGRVAGGGGEDFERCKNYS